MLLGEEVRAALASTFDHPQWLLVEPHETACDVVVIGAAEAGSALAMGPPLVAGRDANLGR